LGGVFFLLWFYFWRYFFGCGFEGVFWLYYYFLGFFKLTPQALPLLPRILCIQLFFKKVEHSPVYLEGRMELVAIHLLFISTKKSEVIRPNTTVISKVKKKNPTKKLNPFF